MWEWIFTTIMTMFPVRVQLGCLALALLVLGAVALVVWLI